MKITLHLCKVSFFLRKPRKTQHIGPSKSFSLRYLDPPSNLCPVRCLEYYISVTKRLRSISNSISSNRASSLFICHRIPNDTATSATIGQWLKKALLEAGIDIWVFSAHSTRRASKLRRAKAKEHHPTRRPPRMAWPLNRS